MQSSVEKKAVLDSISKLNNDEINKQIIAKIVSDLANPKREIRLFSIARIKKMRINEAVEKLQFLENDPDMEIRQFAQKAILKLNNKER
jgi:hypothetical protein